MANGIKVLIHWNIEGCGFLLSTLYCIWCCVVQ